MAGSGRGAACFLATKSGSGSRHRGIAIGKGGLSNLQPPISDIHKITVLSWPENGVYRRKMSDDFVLLGHCLWYVWVCMVYDWLEMAN